MRPHGKIDRFDQAPIGNHDEDGSSERFARKELEPRQFFVDLSLLICEARQPELSQRGRVQGPHCSYQSIGVDGVVAQQSVAGAAVQKSNLDGNQHRHICDQTNERCVRARRIEEELRQLWSRGIPACLTVLLLPDECSKQETCIAEAIVLEKWTIQQIAKRTREDRVLPGQFLMQAVRSHLHFSQLSAWLTASRGKSPTNIIYRVCLPGESETSVPTTPSTSSATKLKSGQMGELSSNGDSVMEKHQFPLCSAGKNLSLSVMVESMPRCERPPSRSCYCLRPSTSGISMGVETEKEKGDGDGELSTSISTPVSNSGQSNRSQRSEESNSEAISGGEKREEHSEEGDSPSSPLDASRSSASLNSFCDERSRSSPPKNEDSGQQQLAFIPLSLPPLVSSPSFEQGRRQILCATNPLFEISIPTSSAAASFLQNKYHLKNRVDALRNEASLLSAKLRTLSSTSAANSSKIGSGECSKTLFSSTNRPRFFVADDDEEEDDEGERDDDSGQISRSQVSDQQKCDSDSKAAKRILFSNDDNGDDFSDWIEQTVDGADDDLMAVAKIDTVEMTVEESEAEMKVARNRSFNERQIGNKRESTSNLKPCSSGHNRKAKRMPTVNAAAAAVQFHPKTGLPLSSSPAPLKRNHNSFNYDPCITSVSTLKSALYYHDHESGGSSDSDSGGWPLCKSAPASTNLLGSFEESALNGRIKPFGSVDGFTLELGASGAFCPTHVTLSVTTLFFNLSDDNAPSPYFGLCSLESVGRRGYHVPKKGSVQATLFNPQGTVVKMFVVRYDLCDMPPSCQTFVRQRTFFMPSTAVLRDAMENRSWLRYLIHLRFLSSSSGKLFLHTDIRMLFSRKSELEAYNFNCVDGGGGKEATTYELRSFTEMPKDPKFSPRKFSRSGDKERPSYR